jgi:hypothetical protein
VTSPKRFPFTDPVALCRTVQIMTLLGSALVVAGCGRNAAPDDAHAGAAGAQTPRERTYRSSGVETPRSLREAYPDYRPGANDAELESVKRGRRIVEKRQVSLDEGGAAEIRELVENVVIALDAADGRALDRNAVTYHEFETILWPEFPQSRPAVNVPVGEAWDFLHHRNIASFNRTTGDVKGKGFRVARVAVAGPVREFTNFRLHEGISVTVANDAGEAREFTMIRSVVECQGRFKVYSTWD